MTEPDHDPWWERPPPDWTDEPEPYIGMSWMVWFTFAVMIILVVEMLIARRWGWAIAAVVMAAVCAWCAKGEESREKRSPWL